MIELTNTYMRSPFWIALLSLTMLLPMSCKDPCDKVDCGTYSTCREVDDEALCSCEIGWEKNSDDFCEVRSVNKFVGTWQVAASCLDQNTFERENLTYSVNLTAEEVDVDVSKVYIQGLGGLPECSDGTPVAQVDARVSIDFLTISPITYCPDQDKQFTGYRFEQTSGEMNDAQDEITLEYRVSWSQLDDSGNLETTDWTCESVWTK